VVVDMVVDMVVVVDVILDAFVSDTCSCVCIDVKNISIFMDTNKWDMIKIYLEK
jgi:hypothetical protein